MKPIDRLQLYSGHLARLSCEHPAVVEAVDPGQVLEHVIVRGEGGRGEDGAQDGVGRVVEGVAGHQRPAVDVPGQHELDLADPLLDRLRLGLGLLVVLLEVVGEVSVEVEAPRVVSTLASLTRAFAGNLGPRYMLK